VKVLVLTTSYPRDADDPAGRFVASSVEATRGQGIDVEVVSPAGFRHFGIAYGHGIVGNVRRRPWLALLLPFFLWSFRGAARRVECDLVHAHWLAAGAVAATLRRPFVVQVWGTDVALAKRTPWLARWIFRRAELVVAASAFLEGEARALGARSVHVVPAPVEIPPAVGEPDDPPHVLYAGRLSPEKGIEDFLAATDGLPRVIVGTGPVRVPESVGAVAPAALGAYYERAALVCVPSRREGYGMVAREAMAHGRPVVATRAGGLVDAIDDGVDGMLVERRDLRAAVERLLGDAELRARLGAAAREKARREWSEEACARALRAAYERATAQTDSPNGHGSRSSERSTGTSRS
jgi:glycosyltransferase involved in cell wall biosynthesis